MQFRARIGGYFYDLLRLLSRSMTSRIRRAPASSHTTARRPFLHRALAATAAIALMGGALVIASASPAAALPCALPTSGSSFAVTSEADLVTLGANADCWAEDIVQSADIALSAPNANLVPIGSSVTPFTGTYNGQDHSITGVAQATGSNYAGIFGYIDTATISNLTVEGAVGGINLVGGVIGYANLSNVLDVHSNVTVTGAAVVGGVIGSAEDCTFLRLSATGSVGSGMFTGGLIGVMQRSYLTASTATGMVTSSIAVTGGLIGSSTQSTIATSSASGYVSGGSDSGGLVGAALESLFNQTFATGNTVGTSNVGGLIGNFTIPDSAAGVIVNSYSRGNVTDTDGATGGVLVGRKVGGNANDGTLTITDVYATGVVTGPSTTTYDLVGDPSVSSPPIVTDSFTLAPPNPPDLTSITTFTAAGWDIDENWSTPTVWGICPNFNDGMPFLKAFYDVMGPCDPPQYSSVTPDEGSTLGDDVITIIGTRLHLVTAVRLGDVDCKSFTIVSDTEITCVTPPHAAGRVSFAIFYIDGSMFSPDLFEYVVPDAPVVPAFTG